jgi:hypothetical protein
MKKSPSLLLPRMLLTAFAVVALCIFTGCGPNITGTYVGVPGQSVFDKIELQGGGKVVVTLIGIPHEAKYTVSGSKVVVDNGGQKHELTIDANGCLVDGIGGRYCKSSGGASAASDTPAKPKSGGLSGTSYVAKGMGGRAMTLKFTSATNFNMVLSGDGMDSSLPGTYELNGNQVLLKVMGDVQGQVFTLKDNTLTGSLDGEKLTFTRN